jgi:hypothetical protein
MGKVHSHLSAYLTLGETFQRFFQLIWADVNNYIALQYCLVISANNAIVFISGQASQYISIDYW